MRVLLFHPTLLPPKDYGGVERVVLWLAKGLVERGHEVWVGALAGSRLPPGARLLEFEPEGSSALDLLRKLPPGIDVVHFQAPPEAGVLEKLPGVGVLTVHGNGKPGEKFPANTVFLSRDHANRHGAQAFVYNGIDPSEYELAPQRKRDEHLFLSKTSWSVKNLRGAIRLCARARARLAVAGGNRPLGCRIRVALNPGMRWIGPVAGEPKARALAEAKALVFPVLWPEPFGLVMAEALMSGTPVLASPRGSVPEIVGSSVGATPRTEEEWLDWLSRPRLPWSPEACRQEAMDRFHYAAMARSYEEVYKKVIARKPLNDREPVASDWRTA